EQAPCSRWTARPAIRAQERSLLRQARSPQSFLVEFVHPALSVDAGPRAGEAGVGLNLEQFADLLARRVDAPDVRERHLYQSPGAGPFGLLEKRAAIPVQACFEIALEHECMPEADRHAIVHDGHVRIERTDAMRVLETLDGLLEPSRIDEHLAGH